MIYLHRHAILSERGAREMALAYFTRYTFAHLSNTYIGILLVYIWVNERFHFQSPLYSWGGYSEVTKLQAEKLSVGQ